MKCCRIGCTDNGEDTEYNRKEVTRSGARMHEFSGLSIMEMETCRCACDTKPRRTTRDVGAIACSAGQEASFGAIGLPVLNRLQPDHFCSCLSPLDDGAMEDSPALEAKGVHDVSCGKTALTRTTFRLILELPISIHSLPPPSLDDIPIKSVPPRRRFVWVWSCVSIFTLPCPFLLLTLTKCSCGQNRIGISTQDCTYCGVPRCANCVVQKISTR